MEVNNISETKDGGDNMISCSVVAPSQVSLQNLQKQKSVAVVDDGTVKKKRRRGKSKRKMLKPFMKIPWQNRRRNDKAKKNNRFRKLVVTKSHAPYNNNQFLMEIHKPEPEGNFNLRTPSARTRDSSFSVDSEENYFYSLPEDEEEFLTKEFSSVYEDAQSERLANMTKNELIQEYLLLEAKYENLVKRSNPTYSDEEEKESSLTDRDASCTDKDSFTADNDRSDDKDMSDTSLEIKMSDDAAMIELLRRLKEQEEQIHELKISNDNLRMENEKLHQRPCSSSEDSESDSSSTSFSCSSSSRSNSPVPDLQPMEDAPDESLNHNGINGHNATDPENSPLVNGFNHSDVSQ